MNKPVVMAGAGVFGAESEFYDFINRVKAPVLLTWKAMGLLPDNHPLYCGRPGAVGQYAANRILQECDFLLVLGAKMDKDQTAYQLDKIAPKAKIKCVVDIDESELQKFGDSWVKCHGEVKEFIYENRYPLSLFANDTTDWLHYCKSLNVNHPVVNPLWWKQETVNYYCFLEELSKLASCNDVIAPECSNAAPPLFQSWKVKQGQRFPYAGALGAMGQGIPGAIGSALATGNRVLCPVGDGGFMLNVQELEVIHRLQLPIKLFVMDNGGYGAIMNTQRAYFGRLTGCNKDSGLTLPDIESVCEAFKLDTFRINKNWQIKGMLEHVMRNDRPEVTIVRIPNDFQFEHRVKRVMVNGTPTSGAFDDID